MSGINIKKLIELIVTEVINELDKRGYEITFVDNKDNENKNDSYEIDMREFKTPVLTENMLTQAGNNFSRIVIPKGTVITPGAKEFINKKRIKIIYKQI
ncbi:hypothetical protein MROS_0103 [Melioribacter roseus P3M-2]|uniref:Uncharacterized protein n=1 Tax=Melioribacter roseus (strain DSM 23840 / JCM 17771 / VKM B-2668 / P3M-2) TaxID=1191523 RepID=I6YS18_MELRP|nr:hypothetical protein [Melioribacter roseus]AFN73347.1 hypothetical protein MROS_0103 [Melioribacter roseus P3M-2]